MASRIRGPIFMKAKYGPAEPIAYPTMATSPPKYGSLPASAGLNKIQAPIPEDIIVVDNAQVPNLFGKAV